MTRSQQIVKLRQYLKYQVIPFSKFYREAFAKNSLTAGDIQTWDDLRKIPFSSKADLVSTPENPRRSLDFVIVPDEAELKRRLSTVRFALLHGRVAAKAALESEYRPIFMTSTTGRSAEPVPFMYSQHDIENLCKSGRQMVEVIGARKDDRVINMFPFAPHLAFWQTHYATISYPVFCLSSGGGKVMGTEGNIRLMAKINPTCLIAMPTFLYHLLRQALDEGVRCDKIRLIVLGGEKVPSGMREKLRSLVAQLGSPDAAVLATYGFTEAKMAWPECASRDGSPTGYHIVPELGIVEIVHPDTGEPQPDGTGGEIVFTALDARGTAVIRYRTGDCIDGGITYAPCPHCGRNVPRLVGNISRASNVLAMSFDKLKGTIVDFNELEHLLDGLREIGAWQLEIRKLHDDPLDVDELILHTEKRNGGTDEDICDHVNEAFSAATELRLNKICFHTAAEMRKLHGVGHEIKEKRVVDHRPK